ncbi:MAG: acyl-CoA thioesterase [Cyclobacteriaceae bacterium]|nr:acyl-CoA thioesterase [Cyclobacteriaceae bacterium]MDH4298586.1 acyl-CoA thioesterase [Cyclobacteriaceae bacterium]MDH5251131.1 acyl-CoA thioesterase [Cyclobacteriaceae bacterium]
MTEIIESSHFIRFPDCDPFNHLNNARYLDYFINAREDHLQLCYNFNIYKHAMKTGESWVIANSQIAYLSPAMLMEKVYIQSKILEWNAKDLIVEMQMWNNEKTKLKSVLRTKFIHFNIRISQKINHSDYLRKVFNIHEQSSEKCLDFDSRLSEIKKNGYSKSSIAVIEASPHIG